MMSPWRLILRSLAYYWRTHAGVLLGSAVAAAVLTGALLVGDAVRGSLREMALARLGRTHLALSAPGRLFRAGLAGDLTRRARVEVVPVLALHATAGEGPTRANDVQVLGVTGEFWGLAADAERTGREFRAPLQGDEVLLNDALADRLNARPGDEVLLRIEQPSLLPRDAPLSGGQRASIGRRFRVRGIVRPDDLGRFDLRATPIARYNAFLPLASLGDLAGQPGKANLLLIGADAAGLKLDALDDALKTVWNLEDAGLKLRNVPGGIELDSQRVFLEGPDQRAARQAGENPTGLLTYLVNSIRKGDKATPYSMAAAVSSLGDAVAATRPADTRPAASLAAALPANLRDDEILIHPWLAEDLDAKAGDTLTLTYFVLGEGRQIKEQSREFRVRSVLDQASPLLDPTLMPEFPGIAAAESCRDWNVDLPIEYSRVRVKDEQYWSRYRGTPKAIVSLAAGRDMWANRFGDLTAVRFAAPAGPAALRERIRSHLAPAELGLAFQDVRTPALAATAQADFAGLFLGFSFFLIAAALILTGLLFALGVQQRSTEMGTLLAVGLGRSRVRRLLLGEGAALALAAGVIGLAGGVLYTWALLGGLGTIWSGAIGGNRVAFHVQGSTLGIAFGVSVAVALATVALVVWRQARKSPARLLSGDVGEALYESPRSGKASRHGGQVRRRGGRFAPALAVLCLMAAGGLLGALGASAGPQRAGAFFGAGALLLTALICLAWTVLGRLGGAKDPAPLRLGLLALRNASRRRGRSLAVIALLACGTFLVAAVGANRHDPTAHAELKSSGTGGFAYYGQTAFGVAHDLTASGGQKPFGLTAADLAGAELVQMRLREGDDASCLTLSRARRPRIQGVRPEALAGRFSFAATLDPPPASDPWALLNTVTSDGAVPAVADEATIVWAMGKKLGDTLEYAGAAGGTFRVRLVGSLKNSILQGSLIVSERNFLRLFPSQEGYRVFLLGASERDGPRADVDKVAERLAFAMSDAGLEIASARDRLAAFSAVENTYLSIFLILGALGLLLGSAALALVVLRNVMERRNELALLRAVGWRRAAIRRLILREHAGLLLAGLGGGALAGVVAVLPAALAAGGEFPWLSLPLTLLAVAASGLLWTWLAVHLALRGPLLDALRTE